MKRFVLLFITSLMIFTVSSGYAGGGGGHGGGHGGGGHGGGHGWGGHGGGHGWGGHGGGLYFGFGGYYPRPYYYYPPYYPVRVIRRTPATSTIYVERQEQVKPAYWYYCTEPKGYYPQVERCSTNWLQVVPKSPDD